MMRLARIVCSLLLFVAISVSAQDAPRPGIDVPRTPAEAPKHMTLPPGFEVTLFAGEPDLVQPIAMTFDDRGRLWVVECLSWPHLSKDGTGNDRVTIFE